MWISLGTFIVALICFTCGSLLLGGGFNDSDGPQQLPGYQSIDLKDLDRTRSNRNPGTHYRQTVLRKPHQAVQDKDEGVTTKTRPPSGLEQSFQQGGPEEFDDMWYLEKKLKDSIVAAGYISLGAGIIMLASLISFLINY